MTRRLNRRVLFLLILLGLFAVREIAVERRPSFLRPGLHLYAYTGNAQDGTVTAIDLVRLAPIATVSVGPSPSGVRANPARNEIWGVSSGGGYAWAIDTRTNQVVAHIPVGADPFALEFSADGRRAYVAGSGSNSVVEIDCATRSIIARGHAGRQPWIARISPDNKTLLVSNRGDDSLSVLDAQTLAPRGIVPVAPAPEHIAILPDNSKAFVSSGTTNQLSIVDIPHRKLLANLALGGRPSDLVLKPDGGELYIPSPDVHGLLVVNTSTNEVDDFVVTGLDPVTATLSSAGVLYVSDASAGHVVPVAIDQRQVLPPPIAVGEQPGASALTPGGDMLLVADQGSDDVAVVRTLAAPATTPAPPPRGPITLVPVGGHPRDLALKVF